MLVFDPYLYVKEVVLVGCGGTGSQIARTLARIIRMMQDAGKSTPQLRFVDPDIIEAKNIGRQLYTGNQLGLFKSVELARRFNYALGLDIDAIPAAFDPDVHVSGRGNSTILIGAVDNWAARKSMVQIPDVIFIDSGNSRHSGQVVIGNTGDVTQMKGVIQRHDPQSKRIRSLPNVGLLYPQLLEPDPEEEQLAQTLSCAELLELSLQSATINQFVASIAAEYVRKLLYREDILTWFTHIDTTTLTMKSTPITLDNIIQHTPGLKHMTHTTG